MDPFVDQGAGATPHHEEGLLRLWAPYRTAYIAKASGSEDPFLELPQRRDEDALMIARGEHVFCALNLYPYNPGHMLVVPYRQVADLVDLTDEETLEVAQFTKQAIRALRAVSKPAGITVGINLGRAAGGSVPNHFHQHIVPRWEGDTNFMVVLSGTKVLPQLLQDTRALLAEAWEGPGKLA